MSWCKGKCPYLSRNGECRMAAQLASLPVNTCPVADADCAECLASHEPSDASPTAPVERIARAAVSRNQPQRLRAFNARHKPPVSVDYREQGGGLPCIHRGGKLREDVCKPCNGAAVHAVYHCNLKGRECTQLPSESIGSDGEPVEYCLTCTQRQVRARAPQRPKVGYITSPDGRDCSHAWGNRFKGSVFLVCGGPSLNEMDLSPLSQRGIMVAAVNNVAASHVRPQLWFSADDPAKFHQSIFADPHIACFVRDSRSKRKTRMIDGDKSVNGPAAGEYPNVWQYRAESVDSLRPEDFLATAGPAWPRASPRRSVMLPALRMLIDFGFTTIYLLGCDFKMHPGKIGDSTEHSGSYAFGEGKDDRACRSNNGLFASVDGFFSNLNPLLKGAGIRVFNCTPGGIMTAFERLPFSEAVDRTLAEFPKVESLYGYYWRAA